MANIIKESYLSYTDTKQGFERFHNEVINMPRATFSGIGDFIKLLKNLSAYIMCIDSKILTEEINYKVLYENIFENYKAGIYPVKELRNEGFEDDFLNMSVFDYEANGRRFRHYAEYLSLFGGFIDNGSRNRKFIDIDVMKELMLTPEEHLFDILRNQLLNLNIKNNNFIKNLKGITVTDTADYVPARAIIKYMNELNRTVTSFELCVLLGRIDTIQKEDDILYRALNIGRIFPKTREDQVKYLFGALGWKSGGVLFEYAQSQNPDFKFKVFLLLMKTLGLVNYNENTETLTLTEYSNDLLKEDISVEILDLNKLLEMIDDDREDTNKLTDIILRKRTTAITNAISADSELVKKINLRSIRNPIIKKGKRMRNKLIAELAKTMANYTDEVSGGKTFEGKNGNNYVEAHHIIEFSTEKGPDIIDNIICLGPQNHSLMHHGSSNAINDFYISCQTHGVITYKKFENICMIYQCLTKDHIKILIAKGLISKTDADKLDSLVDQYGVNPIFLKSLEIDAI